MRNPISPARLVAVAALALVAALPAHAQRDDKKQPINYSADTGDVNYQTKIGNLAGNVIITQGTMTIRADRIKFRQKREGTDEYFEGYAQRAEYDGEKELLELFDRALLKRGQDEIRSNYISYNTKTELFRAEGRPDSPAAPADGAPGARVRGVFQPKDDGKDKDNAKAPAKAADKAGDAKAATPPKPAPLPLKSSGDMAPKAAK
jgi:lipopolysaccharide export system protein LptA